MTRAESYRLDFESSLTSAELMGGIDNAFAAKFSVAMIPALLDQGRDKMVTSNISPSVTIARCAFGDPIVKMIIKQHLFAMSSAMGVSATEFSVSAICDDIISGYGDLKLTELILAFKMIREGKFRDGVNGTHNRGSMYGTLSSDTICDCLNRFRFEYRNPILDEQEKQKHLEEKRRHDENVSSYEEKRKIIFASVLTEKKDSMMWKLNALKHFLNNKDMATLEYYAKERNVLLLLRQRAEEYIMGVDAYNEAHPDNQMPKIPEYTALLKGVKYITDNFPYDVVDAATAIVK